MLIVYQAGCHPGKWTNLCFEHETSEMLRVLMLTRQLYQCKMMWSPLGLTPAWLCFLFEPLKTFLEQHLFLFSVNTCRFPLPIWDSYPPSNLSTLHLSQTWGSGSLMLKELHGLTNVSGGWSRVTNCTCALFKELDPHKTAALLLSAVSQCGVCHFRNQTRRTLM